MTLVRGERQTHNGSAKRAVPETQHAVPAVSEIPDPLKVQALDVFAADLAAGHRPSIRAIRSKPKIGQPRAQQVQAYLTAIHE